MKVALRFFLACTALLALCFAQSTGGESYRLRPEDVLRLQVLYPPAPINVDLPVSRDGTLSAPFIGPIRAEGRTLSDVQDELTKAYADRLKLREPRVGLSILRFRPIRATVGGFVARPGVFEVQPGDRISQLINLGGGQIPDRSNLRRATLRRKDNPEAIPVDLEALILRGDSSQDYELQDGDVLSVPEDTGNFISIQGMVQSPGRYTYKEPMTLHDAISLARGEIRYRTRFSRVMIIRPKSGAPGQYTRIQANYVRFIRNGDSTQNVILKAGDLVYVPETDSVDFDQLSRLANTVFVFDRLGSLFGFQLFKR